MKLSVLRKVYYSNKILMIYLNALGFRILTSKKEMHGVVINSSKVVVRNVYLKFHASH